MRTSKPCLGVDPFHSDGAGQFVQALLDRALMKVPVSGAEGWGRVERVREEPDDRTLVDADFFYVFRIPAGLYDHQCAHAVLVRLSPDSARLALDGLLSHPDGTFVRNGDVSSEQSA